jgi:hypothetical protein
MINLAVRRRNNALNHKELSNLQFLKSPFTYGVYSLSFHNTQLSEQEMKDFLSKPIEDIIPELLKNKHLESRKEELLKIINEQRNTIDILIKKGEITTERMREISNDNKRILGFFAVDLSGDFIIPVGKKNVIYTNINHCTREFRNFSPEIKQSIKKNYELLYYCIIYYLNIENDKEM